MDNLKLEYEQPCFYIAIPYSKEGLYVFIAYPGNEDDTPIRCDDNIVTVTALTIFEDYALTFICISDAIKWYEKNFDVFKHKIEEESPGCFNWDKAVIIKKEYTVVPLGKI